MPAASAFGARQTHTHPTSRGWAGSAGGQRRWREADAHPPHEQGVGVLRFVPVGAVVEVDGGRPTSRGRPSAAFLGTTGSPKRDSQGMDPLSGCGQSPPFSPRDGGRNAAASWSVGRCVLPPRRAVRPFLKGKPLRKQLSPATNQNQARQLCSAFAPQGQTASPPHTGSAPCPRGTRQRRPTHHFADGRLLLQSLPPSTPTAASIETKRSAPAPCSWGGRASSLRPKTQAGGTAAPSYPHIFP